MHRTYRKGTPKFNHDAFSRLYLDNNKENFQLHTWEYLITDELIGYVITKNKKDLLPLQKIEGYGCKLGKEGYGIVTEIEIVKLEEKTIDAILSTIVPMEALLQTNQFINGCDIYNLYRYNWLENQNDDESYLTGNQPTKINGFIPFVVGYFKDENTPQLNYYSDTNQEINIPISLVNLLQQKGEINNESSSK